MSNREYQCRMRHRWLSERASVVCPSCGDVVIEVTVGGDPGPHLGARAKAWLDEPWISSRVWVIFGYAFLANAFVSVATQAVRWFT